MAIRWDYIFSYSGPKKKVGGTTFYKVKVGSETRWLSTEGVNMLYKAREAGVAFKTVKKAMKHFTAQGTQRRVKRMKGNIKANLEELLMSGMEGFNTTGKPAGIISMLRNAGLDKVAKEFSGLLDMMTEEQLRRFYSENKLLLEKFFETSDEYRSPQSTEEDIGRANESVRRNAEKLRDKMVKMIADDMNAAEIAKVKDPAISALLMRGKARR